MFKMSIPDTLLVRYFIILEKFVIFHYFIFMYILDHSHICVDEGVPINNLNLENKLN